MKDYIKINGYRCGLDRASFAIISPNVNEIWFCTVPEKLKKIPCWLGDTIAFEIYCDISNETMTGNGEIYKIDTETDENGYTAIMATMTTISPPVSILN